MLRLSILLFFGAACSLAQAQGAGQRARFEPSPSSQGASGILLAADGVGFERFEPGSSSGFRALNAGASPAALSLRVLGRSGWRLVSSDCPARLAPRQSCRAVVAWEPSGAERASGSRAVLRAQSAGAHVDLRLFGAPAL